MPEPRNIYAIWLDDMEKEEIKDIFEKYGVLGTVCDKIRSAEATKGM